MSDDVVSLEVRIEASADLVFDLFTQAELLVRWMGISASLEPRAGGEFRFEVAPGQFCSGTYLEVDRPRRVVFTWGYESGALPVAPGATTVEVDIEELGDHCRVRLTHSGLEGPMRAMHEEGWGSFLRRLAAVAEGRDQGDDPAAAYRDGRLPTIPKG